VIESSLDDIKDLTLDEASCVADAHDDLAFSQCGHNIRLICGD
jgi:hypothetical protein